MDAYLTKSLSPPLTNPMFLLASLNKVSKDLSKRCPNLIKDFLNWQQYSACSVICLYILVILIIIITV